MSAAIFTTRTGLPLRSSTGLYDLEPHLLAAASDALELTGDELAAVEAPRTPGTRGCSGSLFDEDAVVLALHVVERVPEHAEKVVVGRVDRPVHRELDHGLRAVDRGRLTGLRHGLLLDRELRGDDLPGHQHAGVIAAIVEDRRRRP
ncbi:MAG: hypothetical protein U0326_28035 [Polyangiales bacterium]